MNNDLNIYQKNWAFTSSDAETTRIITGSFGPCYAVSFTSGRFAALAHIDDTTDVNSIQVIFDEFSKNSVKPQDVKVIILGGWAQHEDSYKWGQKIVQKMTEAGVKNINQKYMFSKQITTIFQAINRIPLSDLPIHYYHGVLVDATKGNTFIFKKLNMDLEKEQLRQIQQFGETYGRSTTVELPINRII